MVSDILKLIRERKLVTLSDLCIHFDMTESAIKPILGQLIRKGYVKHLQPECNSCSSDCSSCSFLKDKDYYQSI